MANKKVSAAKKRYAELKKKEQQERASAQPEGSETAEGSVEPEAEPGLEDETEQTPIVTEAIKELEIDTQDQQKSIETPAQSDSEADAFDAAISQPQTHKDSQPETKPLEGESPEPAPKPAPKLAPKLAPEPAPEPAAPKSTPPILDLEEELISVQEENDTLKARVVFLENKVRSLEAQLAAVRSESNDEDLGFTPPPGAVRTVPDLYSESETVTQIRQSMGKFKDFNLDMRTWQFMSGIGPIISI